MLIYRQDSWEDQWIAQGLVISRLRYFWFYGLHTPLTLTYSSIQISVLGSTRHP